jgi:acyl transferase domain-containing protein
MSPHSNYENNSTHFQNGTEHPDSNINDDDPVAVIGVALRFPQDAVSSESFWEMLVGGKSARTKVPEERYNIDAFYQSGESKSGTV